MRRRAHVILAVVLLAASLLFVGCANPINKATFQRYMNSGDKASAAGNWERAEEAYHRAEVNVKIGYLGPVCEADASYNLGRVKRIIGKLDDSEALLKRALALDEQLI